MESFVRILLGLSAVVASSDAWERVVPEPAFDTNLNYVHTPSREYLGAGMEDYMWHVGTPGTQHRRAEKDPYFYTTNSFVPNLPQVGGFTGTHGTYRFFQIIQESLIVVGEPKKGLWRIQENGHVRLYRKWHCLGIRKGVDPNLEELLTWSEMIAIWDDYDTYRYFYPHEAYYKVNYKKYLNYIDLSIYHSKFLGKYDKHVAIDLPIFYSPLSQIYFPYVWNLWNFVKGQKIVKNGCIGPLGERAGLDITENYERAVRLYLFPDAFIWVNTVENIANINQNINVKVNYKGLDLREYEHEIYVVERRLHGRLRLFIALVIDDKGSESSFSYMRKDPNNWYYKHFLYHSPIVPHFNDVPRFFPSVRVLNETNLQYVLGLPVANHDEPDRPRFGLKGGACPQMGGDLATYPWGVVGAGWPTNYQETIPICDGFVVDLKLWTNLWVESWNDPSLNLGNAAFDSEIVYYQLDSNLYGKYSDPYLIGQVNPYMADFTGEGSLVYPDEEDKPNSVVIPLNFTRKGSLLLYHRPPEWFYVPTYTVPPRYRGPVPAILCDRIWRFCPLRNQRDGSNSTA